MRRRAWLLCIGMAASAVTVFGSAPAVQWTKTFAGKNEAGGSESRQTADGGYIVVGETSDTTDSAHDSHYYLVKTDANGNVQWQAIDSSCLARSGRSVIQTSDGAYLLVGYGGTPPNVGAQLVKFNSSGVRQWQKIAYDTAACEGFTVLEANGGYALTIEMPGDSAIGLVFTDTAGNRLWRKRYAISYFFEPPQSVPVQLTSDKGFVIGAKALIRTDSLGNQKWLKTYANVYEIYSVLQTSGKGFVAVGGAIPFDLHTVLLRTDSLGNLLWMKQYPDKGNSIVYGIVRPTAGGYLLAGSDSSASAYVLMTDSSGNGLWDENLGYAGCVGRIHQTSDGGFITVGVYNADTVDAPSVMSLTKLAPEQMRRR
jgi:hypothetical protein